MIEMEKQSEAILLMRKYHAEATVPFPAGRLTQAEVDLSQVKAFRTRMEGLRVALRNVGLDETTIKLINLTDAFEKAQGRIPVEFFQREAIAILDLAKAVDALTQRQKEAAQTAELHNKAIADGMAIFRRNVTPFERYTESMKELTALFTVGMLPGGLETFNREVLRLKEELLSRALTSTPRRSVAVGAPTTAMQISPSRTFLPGLHAQQNREQLVKDPQLARVIELMIEQNRLIERDDSVAMTN